MKPIQELRKAIHELDGKEFLSMDFNHITSHHRNLSNMLTNGELQEAGRKGNKIIYSATDKLRPWEFERKIINPGEGLRRKIHKENFPSKVKLIPDTSLSGWRDVSPWMFKKPKFNELKVTVHRVEM